MLALEPNDNDLGRKVLHQTDKMPLAHEGILTGVCKTIGYVRFSFDVNIPVVKCKLKNLEFAYPRCIEENRSMSLIPKFPSVSVKLVGKNNNAFSVMGRCRKALRKGGASEEDFKKFFGEATEGDCDHLLRTVMKWVNVT